MLHDKADVSVALGGFFNLIEKHFNTSIKALWSDNAEELVLY